MGGAPPALPVALPRPAPPPDHPGGWRESHFVFSQAALRANGDNDDWVQLGWFTLSADESRTACGVTGPKVRRVSYRWAHDARYPAGDCPQDVKGGVRFDRWDHTAVGVQQCPGVGAWVESDGRPATRPFLYDCPAHVPAGYGKQEAREALEGTYLYDAAAGTLRLFYAAPTAGGGVVCKKEFYQHVTLSEDGQLVSMSLDDRRSDEPISLGGTHGFAYGSPAPLDAELPLAQSAATLGSGFLERTHKLKEERATPLESSEGVVTYQPARCRDEVYFDHSCNAKDAPPFLAECARRPGKTAYLRFWVDPFPARASREQLFWAWHALHAPNWTGCYHRGSHSYPSLQVIAADGSFRGYVGVELQRSAAIEGGREAPQAHLKTDYKVFRWIKAGSQELAAP